MNPAGGAELTLSRLLEKARLSEYNNSQQSGGAASPSSSPASGVGVGNASSGAANAAGGAGSDPSSQRIIVGVDFGTTYSG